MAKVPYGVETLSKISIVWVGRTNVTDDRRQTDRRWHIASMNLSSRSLKTAILTTECDFYWPINGKKISRTDIKANCRKDRCSTACGVFDGVMMRHHRPPVTSLRALQPDHSMIDSCQSRRVGGALSSSSCNRKLFLARVQVKQSTICRTFSHPGHPVLYACLPIFFLSFLPATFHYFFFKPISFFQTLAPCAAT